MMGEARGRSFCFDEARVKHGDGLEINTGTETKGPSLLVWTDRNKHVNIMY